MEPSSESAAGSPERTSTSDRTPGPKYPSELADISSAADGLRSPLARQSREPGTLALAVDRSFSVDEGGPTPFRAAPFGRSWEHWILMGAGLGGLAVMVVLGLFVDPDPRGFGTHERFGLPSCKPMVWWNVPCPGCGVTTSVSLAAHGRFWASLRNQPFGFLVAIAIPAFAVWCVWHALRGRDLNNAVQRVRVGRWACVLGGLMIIAWVYKIALTRQWIG